MEKIAFTKNTQVITSAFDDGSCHILDQEVEKLCYNQFTGVNYLIKKEKMHEKCSFQPTRLHFTEGQFLTGKSKNIVFLSDKEKSVCKLMPDVSTIRLIMLVFNFLAKCSSGVPINLFIYPFSPGGRGDGPPRLSESLKPISLT